MTTIDEYTEVKDLTSTQIREIVKSYVSEKYEWTIYNFKCSIEHNDGNSHCKAYLKGSFDFGGGFMSEFDCIGNVGELREAIDIDFRKLKYFKVTDDMYSDIADCHLSGEDFDKEIDGYIVYVRDRGDNTEMSVAKDDDDDIPNTFDVCKYIDVIESIKEQREEEDESRRYTEMMLDLDLKRAVNYY